MISRPSLERSAFYVTFGAAIAILFSIAVSQILLGLAFVLLVASRDKLRMPPFWPGLLAFFLGTVVSLALSPDPRAGWPQIRKFYVYLLLVVVYTTFKNLDEIRNLILVWAGVATLAAAWSFVQFYDKYQEAEELHRNFYEYYVGERTTGFMSHWMTFGGEQMMVLLMLLAFLLFAAKKWNWLWIGAAILAASVVLGFTRSIWLGVTTATLYLLWFWRRWLILALPLALLGAVLLVPSARDRVTSLFKPHGDLDSNQHRIVVWRTGLEMIEKHPWFGVGPEEVGPQFQSYVPADIPRPLPTGYYGHLHSIYIHYAAERGLPTMLALLYMIGQILFDFSRGLRRLPAGPSDARYILRGGIAVVIAVLIEGFAELNLGDSEVLMMFLVIVSCGYVAIRETKVA